MVEDLPLEEYEKQLKEKMQQSIEIGDLKSVARIYVDANPRIIERMDELISNGDTKGLKQFYDELDQDVERFAHEILGG